MFDVGFADDSFDGFFVPKKLDRAESFVGFLLELLVLLELAGLFELEDADDDEPETLKSVYSQRSKVLLGFLYELEEELEEEGFLYELLLLGFLYELDEEGRFEELDPFRDSISIKTSKNINTRIAD